MNCYDFDQTIFFPDSSYLFVMHCLRRYPRAVLRAVPGTALMLLLREQMQLNIAVSAVYVYIVFLLLRQKAKQTSTEGEEL